VIVEDMTMEANLQPPQQLALGLKKLFIIKETIFMQFSQITQTRGHIRRGNG